MVFETESGSRYHVDLLRKVWERMVAGERSISDHPLRTVSGSFTTISPIQVGMPVVMVCVPLVEGTAGRIITTSPVVRVYNSAHESDSVH